MINKPNFLITSGTGQNVGKTTLVCQLIEKYKDLGIVAVKITPHFHDSGCRKLYGTNDYTISLEENVTSPKDTSKMLASGANCVYYIQSADKFIPEVLDYLMSKIPNDIPVICESGALRNCINPGLFLMLTKSGNEPKNPDLMKLANTVIRDFNFNLQSISFNKGVWKYL
jgi:hypothetical protein